LLPLMLIGQTPQVEFYVQDNAFGIQKGYALNWKNESAFSFGIFHQSTNTFSLEKKGSNYTFQGASASLRLIKCGKLSFQSNLKMGLVQNTFFTISPELQTNIYIFKIMDIGISTAYRVGEPAFGLKIMLHPFARKTKR